MAIVIPDGTDAALVEILEGYNRALTIIKAERNQWQPNSEQYQAVNARYNAVKSQMYATAYNGGVK